MINKLTELFPSSIKDLIVNRVARSLQKTRELQESEIKFLQLESRHIKNAKLLTDRIELLKELPKGGVVAEIGVADGDFTKEILNYNSPKELILIDSWGNDRYNSERKQFVIDRFKEDPRVAIKVGRSLEVAETFPDEYFDWIYIDTDHSYKLTIKELNAYKNKLKVGGIIAGHDFIMGNWQKMIRYGVIEATYEFCVINDWEILFITVENDNNPSFAIRRI